MSVGSADMAPGTPPSALAIALGPGLVGLADPLAGGDLADWSEAWHRQAQAELGFALPAVAIMAAPELAPQAYAIGIAGLEVVVGSAYGELQLVVPRARTRAAWEAAGLPCIEPTSHKAASWEGAASAAAAHAAGHRVLTAAELIVTELDAVVRRHAAYFYGPRAAAATRARARASVPAPAVALGRRLDDETFLAIACDLLAEGATLAEPAALVTALAAAPAGLREPIALAEYARRAVPELVDPRFFGPPRAFPALRVSRLGTEVLRRQQALGPQDDGWLAGLMHGAVEGWAEWLAQALLGWRSRGVRPVLLCPAMLRRPLADLARLLTPDVTVVATEGVPAGWEPRELAPSAHAEGAEAFATHGLPPASPGPRRMPRPAAAAPGGGRPVVVLRERMLLACSDHPADLLGHVPPAQALALLAGTPAPEVAMLLGVMPAAAADRVIAHLDGDLQPLVVRLMAHHAADREAFALAQGAWLERLGLRPWLLPEPDPAAGDLAPARSGAVAAAPAPPTAASAGWLAPARPRRAWHAGAARGAFDFLLDARPAQLAALLGALPRDHAAVVVAMVDGDTAGAALAATWAEDPALADALTRALVEDGDALRALPAAQQLSLARQLLRMLLPAAGGEPAIGPADPHDDRAAPAVVVLREAELQDPGPDAPRLAGFSRVPAADAEAALRALSPEQAAYVLAAAGRDRTREVLGRMPPTRRGAVRAALASLAAQPEATLDAIEAAVCAHFGLDDGPRGRGRGALAPTLARQLGAYLRRHVGG